MPALPLQTAALVAAAGLSVEALTHAAPRLRSLAYFCAWCLATWLRAVWHNIVQTPSVFSHGSLPAWLQDAVPQETWQTVVSAANEAQSVPAPTMALLAHALSCAPVLVLGLIFLEGASTVSCLGKHSLVCQQHAGVRQCLRVISLLAVLCMRLACTSELLLPTPAEHRLALQTWVSTWQTVCTATSIRTVCYMLPKQWHHMFCCSHSDQAAGLELLQHEVTVPSISVMLASCACFAVAEGGRIALAPCLSATLQAALDAIFLVAVGAIACLVRLETHCECVTQALWLHSSDRLDVVYCCRCEQECSLVHCIAAHASAQACGTTLHMNKSSTCLSHHCGAPTAAIQSLARHGQHACGCKVIVTRSFCACAHKLLLLQRLAKVAGMLIMGGMVLVAAGIFVFRKGASAAAPPPPALTAMV